MATHGYAQSAALLERAKIVLAGGVSSEFRKYNHPHAIFYTHGRVAGSMMRMEMNTWTLP